MRTFYLLICLAAVIMTGLIIAVTQVAAQRDDANQKVFALQNKYNEMEEHAANLNSQLVLCEQIQVAARIAIGHQMDEIQGCQALLDHCDCEK